ncbi:hypothetical protein AHMF7605_19640 [Adhaeribacter arboris]|uniref:Uncharacterized protein n=1 Tax=Adhaeribacter arboris TaxID=2072846 RepID=A0A2T2YJ87_9BACT|nr:hypothetical protein AHMF7605_19640 [Adhaeribacter arboris]
MQVLKQEVKHVICFYDCVASRFRKKGGAFHKRRSILLRGLLFYCYMLPERNKSVTFYLLSNVFIFRDTSANRLA